MSVTPVSVSGVNCVAPAGIQVFVYYYKVREPQGNSYNIVRVFGKSMATKTYQPNIASQFSVQIEYVNVDNLIPSFKEPSVVPKGIASILEKLFLIS